jgi:hypothetical protein
MHNGELTDIDVLRFLIKKAPGRTALQLAIALYGEKSTRPWVASRLEGLFASGEIHRRGEGLLLSPYRYYPARSDREPL